MLAQLAHVLAQLAAESQRGLATLPIWRGQAEVCVFADVLHGAGDGGDSVEIPVRGEQTGQKFVVGRDLSGIGHFEAVNPRLLCEKCVIVSIFVRQIYPQKRPASKSSSGLNPTLSNMKNDKLSPWTVMN